MNRGETRAMRRSNMELFNKHRNLEKNATMHDARRRWLPSYKATLIEVKPVIVATQRFHRLAKVK